MTNLELKIVKSASFNLDELKTITNRIIKELGPVKIKILYCENIELTQTGKKMYVYSKL